MPYKGFYEFHAIHKTVRHVSIPLSSQKRQALSPCFCTFNKSKLAGITPTVFDSVDLQKRFLQFRKWHGICGNFCKAYYGLLFTVHDLVNGGSVKKMSKVLLSNDPPL